MPHTPRNIREQLCYTKRAARGGKMPHSLAAARSICLTGKWRTNAVEGDLAVEGRFEEAGGAGQG
jgi:hypothetical protein